MRSTFNVSSPPASSSTARSPSSSSVSSNSLSEPLSEPLSSSPDVSPLSSSDNSNSLDDGSLGGTGYARTRSGTSGLDRLTDYESPFEASGVFSKTVRATIIAQPVFLSNGYLDTTTFQNSTNTIPVLGTLPANALVSPMPQFASGVGGELQLASTNYAVAVGYTPYQFLVNNILGRAQSGYLYHYAFAMLIGVALLVTWYILSRGR